MSLSIERTYVPFRNFFFICYILQGKIYSDKIFTFPTPYGCLCFLIMASQSLWRKQGRGQSQPPERKRTRFHACTHRRHHLYFLFYFEIFWYGKSDTKHAVCYNKLPCRLSDFSAECLFCACLRCQWYCIDCFMDTGCLVGYFLFIGYRLLHYVLSEWYVWIYQLD